MYNPKPGDFVVLHNRWRSELQYSCVYLYLGKVGNQTLLANFLDKNEIHQVESKYCRLNKFNITSYSV